MVNLQKIFRNKTLLLRRLLIAAIVVYSYGLIAMCEATSQQSFESFNAFYETKLGSLTLRNTALLAAALMVAFYGITAKLSVSVGLVSFPLFAFHLISAFKLTFRNEPLFPWDFSLVGEVSNIMSSINIRLTAPMIWSILYLLMGLVLAIWADIRWLKTIRPAYKRSLVAGLAALVLFLGGSWYLLRPNYLSRHDIHTLSYDQKNSYSENGFVYSFVTNLYKSKVQIPEGYDEDAVTAIADHYTEEAVKTEIQEQPNIIIVMSEAFSDLWTAENLHFEQEVAPNYTALAENYLSGQAMTSEYGGNTANCEFEVLTSYSTYLLPTGTVAYMNYVNQNVDSYVSFLKSQNYYTVALHPYLRSFFSREKAYEVLGFDDYYSEENFEDPERIRQMQYVSDDSVIDRIIEEYEKNQETDQPFFCHTVTMQNHTSYYAEDYPEEEQVNFTADCELSPEEYDVLRSYATGIQLADAALGKLVSYFQQIAEPTVLLFFGDHQPSLYGDSIELAQRIGYTAADNSADELKDLYSTPYLIWNNFEETPTQAETDMSMFHLVPYMTRTLNLDRPVFHYYMDSLYEQVKGFTLRVCADAEGNAAEVLTRKEQEKFQEYLLLVYDGLMGKRYANGLLYP